MAKLNIRDYFTTLGVPAERGLKISHFRLKWLFPVVALALLLSSCQPEEPTNLYAKYADHPSLSLTAYAPDSEDLQVAETAWLAGNYEAAHQAFSALPTAATRQPEILLARGIAALETERFAEAVIIFSRLQKQDSTFSEYGGWYLALTQLQAGNRASARQTLKTLTASNPELREKVENLISDLE